MRHRLLLAVALACAALPAQAALFGDSEAHKRIDEQVKAVQGLAEQIKAIDGRVGGLEGTVNSGTLLNLLNQIEALNAEIARLRGELETANNRLEIGDKRVRDLYLDLDGRMRALETPAANAPASAPGAAPDAAVAPPSLPAETAPMPAAATGAMPTPATAPSPTGSPKSAVAATLTPMRPGASGELASETADYEAAHAVRREGRFADAARLFAQFVAAHPASALAPPAQYWIGDSLFNAKDYRGAITAHRTLIDTYPNSAKIPDSMLNMASCLRESGEAASERKLLEQLVARFPASEAAEKARKRLAARR